MFLFDFELLVAKKETIQMTLSTNILIPTKAIKIEAGIDKTARYHEILDKTGVIKMKGVRTIN